MARRLVGKQDWQAFFFNRKSPVLMIEPRSSGGFASLVLFIGSSWLMYVKANEGKARHRCEEEEGDEERSCWFDTFVGA